MLMFEATNPNQMLPLVLRELPKNGIREESRNGPVLRFPEPTTFVYERPLERVLFSSIRDCNPFFHLLESMWMLAGRQDVAWLSFYNSRIAQYSDDGLSFNAAYGHRLRNFFGFDQLQACVEILRKDPLSRQVVAQLWDASDLTRATKDKACNLSMLFTVRDGRLDLTVFNRSNDIVWGALGANCVHMPFFLQFVAEAAEIPIGSYYQTSNNMHAYLANPQVEILMMESGLRPYDPYVSNLSYARDAARPLVDIPYKIWLTDVEQFCALAGQLTIIDARYFRSSYLREVAVPMHNVYAARKLKVYEPGMLGHIAAADWRQACTEWIARREVKKEMAS